MAYNTNMAIDGVWKDTFLTSKIKKDQFDGTHSALKRHVNCCLKT